MPLPRLKISPRPFLSGWTKRKQFTASSTIAATAISVANPGIVTIATTSGLRTGDRVTILSVNSALLVGGLTIVGQTFTITVNNATQFSLNAQTSGVAATAATVGHALRARIFNLTIFNTSGTDTTTEVYLGGNVRSDWGDVAITKADGVTTIPWAILRETATSIIIAFKADLKRGDTSFYLYYDGPVADEFVIGGTSDQHNGGPGGDTYADRDQAETYLDNFNTRMGVIGPDLIIHGGDHAHYTPTDSATQLTLMEAVFDKFDLATPPNYTVSPGNHDFEFVTLANFRAQIAGHQTWMESSVLYGIVPDADTGPYTIISLDANYNPSGEAHMSVTHQGFGYVDGPQITWLRAALAAASKPVIIYCHQPLCEFDTDQFTLTKEIYHTSNRREIRTVLEQSQKVIAVIHGHMHFDRMDVIRGIPYIALKNLTNDDAFGEIPFDSTGRWSILRFDASCNIIRVISEARISGTVQTVYEFNVAFGPTIYSTFKGESPEEVFKLNYGASWGKSSYLRDPCQLYVGNDDYLYKFPVNLHTPDQAPLYKRSIRIEGRTDNPNFGRATWWYENLSEKFIFECWVMLADQTSKYIKLGGKDTTTSPAIYMVFDPDGNIYAASGAGSLTSIQAYSLNTWYKFELFIDPVNNGYSGRINEVNNIGSPSAYGFYSGNCKAFRELEVVTETGDAWLSSFSFKNWFSPRPSLTGFETEETA